MPFLWPLFILCFQARNWLFKIIFLSFFHKVTKNLSNFRMWCKGNKDNKIREMLLGKRKKKKRRNICAWLYSASSIKKIFHRLQSEAVIIEQSLSQSTLIFFYSDTSIQSWALSYLEYTLNCDNRHPDIQLMRAMKNPYTNMASWDYSMI